MLLKTFEFCFSFKLFFLVFLDCFDVLMSKINFLKNKKTWFWCISKWRTFWKTTSTTLPNRPLSGMNGSTNISYSETVTLPPLWLMLSVSQTYPTLKSHVFTSNRWLLPSYWFIPMSWYLLLWPCFSFNRGFNWIFLWFRIQPDICNIQFNKLLHFTIFMQHFPELDASVSHSHFQWFTSNSNFYLKPKALMRKLQISFIINHCHISLWFNCLVFYLHSFLKMFYCFSMVTF